MSSHKLYGPKGVGALYIRKGTRMIPLLHGGEQERKRRAGTENVPGIIGFGKAMEIAQAQMEQKQCQIANFRDKLIKGLFERIDGIRLNGHPLQRLPNNVSMCIEGLEGEAMLLNLDMKGFVLPVVIQSLTSSSRTWAAGQPLLPVPWLRRWSRERPSTKP
ncbi:MAG: aminotransferase class V-fold PLP-dependent enzyme [Actinomycetota bacterium]|nr:aminotransferase class V-fold PLP-dependent enzyme [Actinomycetota bacterium]